MGAGADAVFRRVQTIAYSYGLDDDSDYRHRIATQAGAFRDIVMMSHQQAHDSIAGDEVDVLLDMQVHTLGNRMMIPALQPAAVQVNYLVYPGTSGTSFLHSIVADRVVLPAEHGKHYTESVLLLPPSYQISYYDIHNTQKLQDILETFSMTSSSSSSSSSSIGSQRAQVQLKAQLRAENNLPLHASIVYCNFNKIDKLDMATLSVWTNVLRAVPGSVLWLLDAGIKGEGREVKNQNELVRARIRDACVASGVASWRIIYAPRVSKALHLTRQLAADLFLDSFVYGAHSTATDALRGGLPVLTVAGGSFPSRVVMSLYESLSASLPSEGSSGGGGSSSSGSSGALSPLVCDSVQQFERAAVSFATTTTNLGSSRTGHRSLSHLTALVTQAVLQERGIFDHEGSVRAFLRGMEGLKEARGVRQGQRDRDREGGREEGIRSGTMVWRSIA